MQIEYFDCANEIDNQKAEKILSTRKVEFRAIVNIPHLMLIWDDKVPSQ